MLLICILLACATALLVVALVVAAGRSASMRGERDAAAAALKAAEQRLAEVKEGYERQIAEIKSANESRLVEERRLLGDRFKALAAEILHSNSRQLDERNKLSVEAVFSPMKAQLEEFARGFRECYSTESRDRLSMREEIKKLHELNTLVGAEAAKLSNALRGNTAMQGRWGEMVLRNILEHSGLETGRWLVMQDRSVTDDGEIIKPDAVVYCPDGRKIIIDSKTSLTSYLASLEADDDDERDRLLKAHVRSVEGHIKTLYEKDYQGKVKGEKGDFVFMFMPHEGAYLAAMRAKPDLWQKAFDSHVVLASPTHLVTALHLVEQMWKTEKQNVNSEKIAEQGRKLADGIAAFLKDLSAVGDQLRKAQDTYDSALRRLQSGNNNVLRVAERLASLGVKSKSPLPPRFSPDSPDSVK